MTLAVQAISGEPSPALPSHIAIIMDGNGRWAAERGVPRLQGHRRGAEALRHLLDSCRARPFITYLTLYAFSAENWQRSPEEVSDLMDLLRHYVKREVPALHQNGIRLKVIGVRATLAPDIRRDLDEMEALTADNRRLTVTLALSYGARQEMVEAARALGQQVVAGVMREEEITAETFASRLNTHDLPDPDLLIRTGGEKRLSNFLLWQSAYTELYFTDTLWPDFTSADLDAAVADYTRRDRRFGKRKEA